MSTRTDPMLAPTPDCNRWALMADGATYLCVEPVAYPFPWASIALWGLGLAGVVGAGVLAWRMIR